MTNNELRLKAIEVSHLAYSPYSHAKVGSAILMSDNSVYTGCNVENASYGGTICAERVAILKAVSEGKKEIKKIYVYTKEGWPPCGMCRQVMSEFAGSNLEIVIGDESGKETIYPFKDLMPLSFTPKHLKK